MFFCLGLVFSSLFGYAESPCHLTYGQTSQKRFMSASLGCDHFVSQKLNELANKSQGQAKELVNQLLTQYQATAENEEIFFWEGTKSPENSLFSATDLRKKAREPAFEDKSHLEMHIYYSGQLNGNQNYDNFQNKIQYIKNWHLNPNNPDYGASEQLLKKIVQALSKEILSNQPTSNTTNSQSTSNFYQNIIVQNLKYSQQQDDLSIGNIRSLQPQLQAIKQAHAKLLNTSSNKVTSAEEILKKINDLSAKPETLAKLVNDTQEVLTKGKLGDGSLTLNSLQAMSSNQTEASKDFKKIYDQLVDKNGLNKQWLEQSSYNPTPVLYTDSTTNVGQAVRDVYNQALEYDYKAGGGVASEKARIFQEWVLQADRAFNQNDKVRGSRYINRAQVALDYETGNPRVDGYKNYKLSQVAIDRFDLQPMTSEYSYGFETSQIANRMAKLPITDIFTYTHAMFALKSLQAAEETIHLAKGAADVLGYRQFVALLENAWMVYEVISPTIAGTINGIKQFTIDTVNGVWQIANHPIDTYEATVSAIRNYDKTYQLIVDHAKDVIEQWPEMNELEQSELIGRIGSEVATIILPIGKLAHAADAQKIKIVTNLAQKAVKSVVSDTIMQATHLKFFEPILPQHLKNISYARKLGIVTDLSKVFDKATLGSFNLIDVHSPIVEGILHAIPESSMFVGDSFRSSTYYKIVTTKPTSCIEC